MKRCAGCHDLKGLTAYWKDRSRPDGLDRLCRACRNAAKRHARAGRPPKPPDPRKGWCKNCLAKRHGRACTAAWFGPDCTCRCAVLGFRDGGFDFTAPAMYDLTGPAPMDRETA